VRAHCLTKIRKTEGGRKGMMNLSEASLRIKVTFYRNEPEAILSGKKRARFSLKIVGFFVGAKKRGE
jgi:hypothetical protein